ncbi:CDK5 regulatory subunit-associated protein 3-like [Lineus longissimus]|uniref:CDK5 regulatory subunit-associated protein 3-like n=1 Tax=Lineus longissimus TaxID=88925 RepID=UPI00315CE24B
MVRMVSQIGGTSYSTGRSMDHIPIDIHYNKLLDWLINRRHCNQQWQVSALVIREKINNAIQDMPPVEEITTLLQGTYINYFHCLRIVELLKETEAGSKNIFGRYSSQRMKDWCEIIKLYEKDGVYLAEVAQMLMRNVNYEVPALKKQIAKCKQVQKDTVRKESEYRSGEAEYLEKYNAACRQMDIKGNKVKSELLSLVKHLPAEFDKITTATRDLKEPVNLYEMFIEFTLKNSDAASSRTPLIRYLQQKGNTSIYEYRTGEKPTVIDLAEYAVSVEEEERDDTEEAGEIDWGAIDTAGTDEGIIDFGAGDVADIDFGDSITAAEDIDWGDIDTNVEIEVEEGGVSKETIEQEVMSEETGVARGVDALTVLDNVETRNKFLDELFELDAFFSQRVEEMTMEADVISSTQLQSAPNELQVDVCQIEKLHARVTDIIKRFDEVKLQHMLSIRSSPRFVDRLSENLSQLVAQSKKFAAMQRISVSKRDNALEEQRALEPKLDIIRKKTLGLKKQIESEISKKYMERPVNIMGEINTM